MRGLFWFRNDLRLHDNSAFCSLTQQCEQLLCAYVIDERWFAWTTLQSKPLGAVRWRFIRESLADLQQNLALKGHTLLIRCGQPERIIAQLVDEFSIDAIGVTRLPATYEQRHLKNLQKSFETKRWFVEESFTLFKQEQLPFALAELPDSFSQFRHHVEAIPVMLSLTTPDSLPEPLFADLPIEDIDDRLAALTSELELPFRGGESAGLQQLRYYLQETSLVSHYKDTRNGLDGWDFSSKLSPWLAQGCVSPRRILSELRAYQRQFGANESTYWLYFELLWREYFRKRCFRSRVPQTVFVLTI